MSYNVGHLMVLLTYLVGTSAAKGILSNPTPACDLSLCLKDLNDPLSFQPPFSSDVPNLKCTLADNTARKSTS